MRDSWLTKLGVICLNQLVALFEGSSSLTAELRELHIMDVVVYPGTVTERLCRRR